jgi:hypothetical protein
LPGLQDVFLADDLAERLRAHPRRERLMRRGFIREARCLLTKEGVGIIDGAGHGCVQAVVVPGEKQV